MQLFITLSALLAVTIAFEYHDVEHKHIPILHSESYHGHDGSFKHRYESANGIQVQEQGYVKNNGGKEHANVVHGSYSHVNPHGVPVSVSYTAANKVSLARHGSHIPTAPPLP